MTIKDKLLSLKDETYQKFSASLLPGVDNIIGVRIPELRRLSKYVKLEELTDDTFEEIMLQGFIISKITDFEEFKRELYKFLPKINNWSVCDSFISSLHLTLDYQEEMFQILKELSKVELEYTRRFVIVMLLRYFLTDKYIKKSCSLVLSIKKREYYVQMATSWFIAEVYFKDFKLGEELIEKEEDIFIKNKSISKIKESNKIPKELKDKWKKVKYGKERI